MNEIEMITTEQLAERWKMDSGTLENWRSSKKGPVFIKLGDGGSAPVRYRLSDIIEYEKQQENRG